jgi:hypothetical protein
MLLFKHSETYQNKEHIKELGGIYKPDSKGWLMPDRESFIEAFALCCGLEVEDLLSDVDIDSYENDEDFIQALKDESEEFYPSGIRINHHDDSPKIVNSAYVQDKDTGLYYNPNDYGGFPEHW